MSRGSALLRPSSVRGSALRRHRAGSGWSLPAGELDPLFASAQLYIDAARRSDGVNEGTAAVDGTVGLCRVDPVIAGAAFGGDETLAALAADEAAFDLTTGFVVAVDLEPESWVPTIPEQIFAKPTGTDTDTFDCYAVGFDDTGRPFIEWDDTVGGHNGPAFALSNGATAEVEFGADDGRKQLVYEFIADNGAGGWTARLYSGTPGATTLLSEIVNTTDGAQTLTTSNASLRVGDPITGMVYRVRLYDTLGGTLLADFNPAGDWSAGTSITAATGETWTSVLVVDEPSFVPGASTDAALTIPDDPALGIGAGEDATLAFWFTQRNIADVDGEAYRPAQRATGTIGAGGEGYEVIDIKVAAFASDFAGALLSDATNNGFAVGAHWAAGTHLGVLVVNRTTDIATFYLDGVSHATADISAVGAIDPAADLKLMYVAHHAVAKWDEALDPADVAAARA